MLGARGGLTGNEASRGGEKELQLQSEDLLGEKKTHIGFLLILCRV